MAAAERDAHVPGGEQIELDLSQGFGWLRVRGHGGFEAFSRALDRLIAHPDFRPGMNALWDLREASLKHVGFEEIRRIVAWARTRSGARAGARVALLVSRDVDYGVARMSEVLSEGALDVQIRTFRDVDAAVRWVAPELAGPGPATPDPGSV